jgi:DNA polymerase
MSLAERSSREQRLANAAAGVERCRKCAIGSSRRNSVYGEGDSCAELMLVGEGPGETEDLLGRPFVGRAGELLDRMLLAIDLPREHVYICNTVKCRPTFDDGQRLRNRAPDPSELANCRPYLDEQIEIIRPSVLLALGAPAAKSFLGATFSITKQRGQWYEGPRGTPLIATFHPAYLLRMTGGELTAVKRLVWDDLKAVRAKLDDLKSGDAAPAPVEQIDLFSTDAAD